jgi:hypothetical protein
MEQVSRALRHNNAAVRRACAARPDWAPTSMQIELGLTDEIAAVRLAWLTHVKDSLTHEQLNTCLNDRSSRVRKVAISVLKQKSADVMDSAVTDDAQCMTL